MVLSNWKFLSIKSLSSLKKVMVIEVRLFKDFTTTKKSDMHRQAMEKMAAKSSKTNVVAQLSALHEANNSFHSKFC